MALSPLHLGAGGRGCSSSVTAVLVQVHTPQQAQKVLALLPSLVQLRLRRRFLLTYACKQGSMSVLPVTTVYLPPPLPQAPQGSVLVVF